MPDPLTTHARLLQEARRELERARREVARWEKIVSAIEGEVAAEESFVIGEAVQPLTIGHDDDTLDTMHASVTTGSLKSRGRLARSAKRHPFIAALMKRNETVLEAREALEKRLGRRVPRSSVQSWYKPTTSSSYRPIPRDAADAIEALYGVPASSWARIQG